MKNSGLGNLKQAEWDYLQDYADRFEKAWQTSGPADLLSYLPPENHPLRAVILQELIKIDLEYRWRRGNGLTLEQYVERHPELKSAGDLPTALILEEHRVRNLYGDKPELTRYQNRFPAQFSELEGMVDPGTEPERSITPPPSSPAPLSPTAANRIVVGHGYALIERIGSGGFGEVWRAEAPGGFECAVKVLFRAVDHDEAKRELQSLELIKRLRHPFLLQTHSYFLHENHLYIVMELADGSLRDRLRECQKNGLQGIPVTELISYFREAAEALDYLHSEKVLHRDIKPDNILVLKGHTKVADFGLARMQEQSQRMASATGSGTPAYMAPEMWGSKVSAHTDQYCLAVSYAELRLGRRLFVGRDLLALMMEHLNTVPDLEPLPRPEQEVLIRAIAKKPDDRHPSCKAFALALEQSLAAELGVGASRPGPPPTPMSSGDLKTAYPGSTAAPSGTSDEYQTVGPTGAAPQGGLLSQTEVLPEEASPRERAWQKERVVGGGHPRRVAWIVGLGVGVAALATVALLVLPRPPVDEGPSSGPPSSVDYLPSHCQKAPDSAVVSLPLEGNTKLYDRIDYLLPDGTRIRFLLIPKETERNPRSFYIMKDKVSNTLFAAFMKSPEARKLLAAQAADKPWVLRGEWQKGGKAGERDLGSTNGALPVLRVTVVEAYCFARWLGGDLPHVVQWDAAAGRFRKNPRAGPFDPAWNGKDKGRIAVNREMEGPMPVGTASQDLSPFGCRDMSGNGLEWTRTIPSRSAERVPLEKPRKNDPVTLRGRSYKDPEPLTFKDLEKKGELEEYQNAGDDIGFRVVLERP